MIHLKELMSDLMQLISDLSMMIDQPRPGECEPVIQARLDACTAERTRQTTAARAAGLLEEA